MCIDGVVKTAYRCVYGAVFGPRIVVSALNIYHFQGYRSGVFRKYSLTVFLLALGVVDQGPSDVSMWLTVVARGMDLTDFEYGMYVCMYAYFE